MFKFVSPMKMTCLLAALIFLIGVMPEGVISTGKNFTTKVEAASVQLRTTANLNMRAGTSSKDKKIMTIPKGKLVTLISKSGTWYKVSFASKSGFVNSKFTTKRTALVKGYDVPILMYHAINEYKGKGLKELYVTPKNFKLQMEYIKSAGFTPITFDEISNIKKIKKPILITLDDGYKNNMNAYKILKEINNSSFKSKATIFMIGQKINTKNGLSIKQIKEISDSGIISIQSHTETHPSLTSTTHFKKELRDSKTKLEKITGKRITAIAYPSGKYNSKVIAETKKYYKYAVTTKPGVANTGSSHYEMKRVRVSYSTSLATFKKLVNQ